MIRNQPDIRYPAKDISGPTLFYIKKNKDNNVKKAKLKR